MHVVKENKNLKTIREALRYVNTIGLYKVSLPNILILLELGSICPFGNAVTERLFSLMKIVKSRLRNRLGQSTLDQLFRVKIESPNKLTDEETEVLADKLKTLLEEKSSSGKSRLPY